jgi:hypothetical protein
MKLHFMDIMVASCSSSGMPAWVSKTACLFPNAFSWFQFRTHCINRTRVSKFGAVWRSKLRRNAINPIDMACTPDYIGVLIMRRGCSISLIVALLAAIGMPQLSICCRTTLTPKICHRSEAKTAHCGMLHEKTEQLSGTEDTGITLSATSAPEKCPMTCCFSSRSVAAAIVFLRGEMAQCTSEGNFKSATTIVISRNLSSLSDRAPPIA